MLILLFLLFLLFTTSATATIRDNTCRHKCYHHKGNNKSHKPQIGFCLAAVQHFPVINIIAILIVRYTIFTTIFIIIIILRTLTRQFFRKIAIVICIFYFRANGVLLALWPVIIISALPVSLTFHIFNTPATVFPLLFLRWSTKTSKNIEVFLFFIVKFILSWGHTSSNLLHQNTVMWITSRVLLS